MKHHRIIIAVFITTFVFVGNTPVLADFTVEISGNGGGSSNEISFSQDQTSHHEQSNSADVSTTVTQTSSTGDNSINGSTANESSITTGSINTATEVDTDVNHAVFENTCCPSGGVSIEITGNGLGSTNSVNTSTSNQQTTSINQSATISNSGGTNAHTGRNILFGNNGGATITTGSIVDNQQISTSANTADIRFTRNFIGPIDVKMTGNGTNSTNRAIIDIFDEFLLIKEENAHIKNNFLANLDTGNNTILGNLGETSIKTGDITNIVEINNGPINENKVTIDCCKKEEKPPPPVTPPPPPPITPPNGGGGNGGRGNDGGVSNPPQVGGEEVLGVAAVLPITGASALHFWILAVVYLLTFLLGLYVRLRAGRSPSRAYLAQPAF